ncbi:MAG: chlorophyll a/b-binding protein [Cyanobacteria bacterium J06648_16]
MPSSPKQELPSAESEGASPTRPDQASAPADGLASVDEISPGFGWTAYAERINGRFAMIGFVALLILELWTGQGFFSWLGLR